MKYKIYDDCGYTNLKEELLARRGVENPQKYINSNERDISSYKDFGKNIDLAYDELMIAKNNNYGIGILSDPDFDGSCASSLLFQYLKKHLELNPFIYHQVGKSHGLSDKELFPRILEDVKSEKIKFLFLPDSSTNDTDECFQLSKYGCKIIILDHHIQEKKNPSAIIINPQISENYKNKFLSGTGVVWQFLRKIDDENWTNHCDDYVDLVAFSIIADSMDIRTLENREFIRQGFLNIKNKFLKALIEKQEYSIKSEINPVTVGFYISPLVNALIRVGAQEEKELMFKAFCQEDEEFDYTKRDKTIIKENIYDRVARLAVNCKSKQDRYIEKGMDFVLNDIEVNNRNNNKILFALCDNTLDKAFTGLIAMRLANLYNKPCVLLRDNGKDFFSGSIRNFNDSPLTNLKSFLQSFGTANFIQGHESASGCAYSKNSLIKTIELVNKKLKDYDFSKTYNVDFSYNMMFDVLDMDMLKVFSDFKEYAGNTINAPMLYLENVDTKISKISNFGKGEVKNVWKFSLGEFNSGGVGNKIDIIKFNCKDDDLILTELKDKNIGWGSDKELNMNMVVKIDENNFNGNDGFQLIVEDYEIV